MSIVDVFDFNKVCRTCLSFGSLKSLYDETTTDVPLANMLMLCTSIKYCANDDLPKSMCTDCISELNQSYKFALKCQETDEELRIYKQKLLSVENAKRQSVIISSLKPAAIENILKPVEIKNEISIKTADPQNATFKMCKTQKIDQKCSEPHHKMMFINNNNNSLDLKKSDIQIKLAQKVSKTNNFDQITNILKEVTPIVLDLKSHKTQNKTHNLDPKQSETDKVTIENSKRHKLDQQTLQLDQLTESQNNLDQVLTERPNVDQTPEPHLNEEMFETNNNITEKPPSLDPELPETHLNQEMSEKRNNLELELSETQLNKVLSQSLPINNHFDEETDIFRSVTPVNEQFVMNIKMENISDCETEILDSEKLDANISDCETEILEAEKPNANISDCDTEILEVEKTERNISDCETEILEIEKPDQNSSICETDILEPNPTDISCKLTNTKTNQKDEASFTCTVCDCSFANQLLLTSHMHTHNKPKPQEIHSCRYCFHTFHDTKKFKEHIPVHVGETPYTCRECNYMVKGIKKFQEHKRFHHEERRYKRSLYNHNKDPGAAPYLYNEASPGFKARPYHMRTHQAERYSHNNAYTRHKVLDSRSGSQYRFACRFCELSFLRRPDLITHSYRMHPRRKRYTSSPYDSPFNNIPMRDEEMPYI